MDSIEICFQGFTNDVVGLNEGIFYCAEMNLKKVWALENILFMFVFSLSYDIRRSYVFLAIRYSDGKKAGESFTTSKKDHHLLRQKVSQRISLMKTNTVSSRKNMN